MGRCCLLARNRDLGRLPALCALILFFQPLENKYQLFEPPRLWSVAVEAQAGKHSVHSPKAHVPVKGATTGSETFRKKGLTGRSHITGSVPSHCLCFWNHEVNSCLSSIYTPCHVMLLPHRPKATGPTHHELEGLTL